jgi:hypothetical protein
MRNQREPWLKVPDKGVGRQGDQRRDPRFRTHVVTTAAGRPAAASIAPTESTQAPAVAAPRAAQEPAPPKPLAAPWPAATRPAPAQSETALASPRVAVKRALGAPSLGLSDLPMVSSADWVAKVGEAANMVDVIVVFYTSAYVTSNMFQLAFQTVVNEVLPQIGRPYAAYRFSLDAEPSFVAEMAESLGLPQDDPITVAGFAWSGPGRRLFLIGDRALESRTTFDRALRVRQVSQQLPFAGERGSRDRDIAGFERSHERTPRPRMPLWGARALAILAWCLFGTAALGAAVVGLAPQWARSLLHPAAFFGTGPVPKDPSRGAGTPTSVVPPAANLDNTSGSPSDQAQAPVNPDPKQRATRVHARKKATTSALTWGPPYWGLPEARIH